MVLSIRKPANWRIANQPVFLPLSIFISSGVAALTKLFHKKQSKGTTRCLPALRPHRRTHQKTARPAGDKNLVQLIRHRIKGGQSPSQKGPASPPGAVQRMKQQNRQQRKFRRMRQFSDHGGRDQQPNQIKNFGKNAIAKRLGLNTGLLRKMKISAIQATANAQDRAQRKACLLDWNRIMNPAAPLSKSAPCHPACGKQSRKHSVPSQRNCSLHTAGKLGRFGSNAFPPACTAE